MCSPSTRGIWFDWLLDMHELDRCGQLSGSVAQLARAGNCTCDEVVSTLAELKSTNAADVTECNGIVTVTNRRMLREYQRRLSNLERVQKHRVQSVKKPPKERACNNPVTGDISYIRDHISDNTPNPKNWFDGKSEKFVSWIVRINQLFGRKPSTAWSPKELSKLSEVMNRPDADSEMKEIEDYYASGDKYVRRDIITLLNNWSGELDRWRSKKKSKPDDPRFQSPTQGGF